MVNTSAESEKMSDRVARTDILYLNITSQTLGDKTAQGMGGGTSIALLGVKFTEKLK